jgi:hypothetical protein
VSRRTCRHLGVKLPDPHSCGARCAEFPSCLPPLPADVVGAVAYLRAAVETQHRSTVAVGDFLELLRQALTEGMARRDGEEPADPTDP